jgi:hypothetical protein
MHRVYTVDHNLYGSIIVSASNTEKLCAVPTTTAAALAGATAAEQ